MSLATVREEWRTIAAPYEVSSLGRVRNAGSGRVLRHGVAKGGYLYVVLCFFGVRKNCKVHTLVAEAFLGKRPSSLDVNHVDGVKSNNCAENLEYVSRSANLRHAFAMGLKTHKGMHSPRCRYSELQVLEVRSYLQQGCRQRDVATFMGVPAHFVADVSSGRNWSHI